MKRKTRRIAWLERKFCPWHTPNPPTRGIRPGFLLGLEGGGERMRTTEHVPGHVSYTLGRGRRGRRKNANISNTEHVPEYVYHTLARGRLREGGR